MGYDLMKRFFTVILLIVFLSLLTEKSIFALEKVTTTAYDITYTVEPNGLTKVLFIINLTNTTSSQYPTAYSLKVGFDNLANLQATDPDGPIVTSVKQLDDGYILTFVFNKKVVGKGKRLTFTVSFTTSDIVQKNGEVWEVNIPGVSNKDEFSTLNTHVKVPPFLGNPSYIKPKSSTDALDFSKDQLGKSGISLFFGQEQIYKFSLTYHLQNTNIFPIKTEVALPPSTNYQQVAYKSILPPPENVRQDMDGNWLAQYYLKPSQKIDVIAKGRVKISLKPTQQEISEQERIIYTAEQAYWQKNNAKIKALARELKTPEAIYNYVVKTLTYDFSRVKGSKPRLGAQQALSNPKSAVCLEFTDLFIAIARAAGIPSRKVDGFAYTQNVKQRPVSLTKDVLHSWPEYYDDTKKTWVMIDPTWGNTTGGTDYFHTLDFDHFAFAIKGKSSTTPIPAGGYKLPKTPEGKDVIVTLTDKSEEITPEVSFSTKISQKTFAGIPLFGTILVQNPKGILYPRNSIIIENSELSSRPIPYPLPAIPPYGHIQIPLFLGRSSFLTNTISASTIRIGNHKQEQTIAIVPLTKLGLLKGGLLFAGITIILLIIAQRTGRIPFFKQKR